jgi:hypothetical protein
MSKKKINKKTAQQEDNINLHKKLRASSYASSMGNIRKRLPHKQQRAFSRFIHARGMDSFNDLLTKTIGRPNSIIGGSIFALIGTFLAIFLSKYYGYSYNYLLLVLFFVLGYLLELLGETIVGLFIKRNN